MYFQNCAECTEWNMIQTVNNRWSFVPHTLNLANLRASTVITALNKLLHCRLKDTIGVRLSWSKRVLAFWTPSVYSVPFRNRRICCTKLEKTRPREFTTALKSDFKNISILLLLNIGMIWNAGRDKFELFGIICFRTRTAIVKIKFPRNCSETLWLTQGCQINLANCVCRP